MSVIRTLLLACIAIVGGLTFSHNARADTTCWNLSPGGFSFGNVTAGQTASANNTLEFQCNNYTQTAVYVRMCLSQTNNTTPVMNTNPAVTPLYYHIYSANEPSMAIGGNNTTYAENTFAMSAGQSNASYPMPLVARIVANQTTIAAGDYYDYNTSLTVKYATSQTESGLPSCKTMTGTTISDSIGANATVKNGCKLVSVDPMDFGEKTPVDGTRLSGSAQSSVVVRCPVGTSYTVAMDMGQHSDGSSRRMCNGSECVTYGLYQDAGGSVTWDNSANVLTEISSTGNNQSIPVYGKIPAQEWPAAGDYTDTVVVTLSY
ncbi:TPA: spore coat U domain-containing protein [Citrobacter freundii]